VSARCDRPPDAPLQLLGPFCPQSVPFTIGIGPDSPASLERWSSPERWTAETISEPAAILGVALRAFCCADDSPPKRARDERSVRRNRLRPAFLERKAIVGDAPHRGCLRRPEALLRRPTRWVGRPAPV
jgi:hypothetical protein